MKRVIFLTLLLIPFASSQWWQNGKRVPDDTWRRAKGDLGVMLLLTRDAKLFLKDWYGTPQSHAPSIRTTDRAVRGDVVAAFVVFTGCMPSPSGTCDGTVDFTVLKPNGSVYSEAKNNPLLTGKSAEAPTVQLSSAHLDIRIEQQDPLGMYTVKAHVRDTRANITIDVEQRFEVVVAIPPGEQPGA
jgi:hypothetical protein